MVPLFASEGLTISHSDDVPGGLVFELRDDEGKEILRQLVSPEARAKLAHLLSHTIMGEFTYGALRVIKHNGGWVEIVLAAWCDPEPIAFVPEVMREKLLEAIQPACQH